MTFGHFPAAFLYPFTNAQQLSNNLLRTFPSG
jgi:hypothetical protein